MGESSSGWPVGTYAQLLPGRTHHVSRQHFGRSECCGCQVFVPGYGSQGIDYYNVQLPSRTSTCSTSGIALEIEIPSTVAGCLAAAVL